MTTSPDPEPPVSMLMHARWWASKSVPVLPLYWPVEGPDGVLRCSCGDPGCEKNAAKHPLYDRELGLRNGLNDATVDQDIVDTWWRRYPQANIGIRTGEVIDLIDMDSIDGFASYMKLVEELGGAPEHFGVAMSGRDGFGMHVYAAPGGMKALAGGKTAPPGIDVKGRGGYAVAPPSRHISGARYRFTAQSFDDGALLGKVKWEDFYRRLEIRPVVAPGSGQRVPRPSPHLPIDAANAYGAAVLRRALGLVDSAMSGTRWQTMATEAIPLVARGIDGGCIDRDSAVRELEASGRNVGLDPREVRRIGVLVDQMLAKGITNPIHPKDAMAKIGDLIASPVGLLAPPSAAPMTTDAGASPSEQSGEDSDEESDDDDHEGAYTGDPRTDPWDPPWPLRYPTPPFPVEEAMGWMAPEIVGLADRLQCPVDLVAMMTLAAVSAAIRGRIRVEVVDGWDEPLNLYIAVVAGAGESKSPALKRLLDPLEEIETEARQNFEQLVVSRKFDREVAEASAKKLRENALNVRDERERAMMLEQAKQAQIDAEAIVVPAEPTFLVGDMTPEALVAELAAQGGVLAHLSAEGALLDTIVGGRYSKGVAQLSDLLRAHDGRETIKVHRRHAPTLVVRNPCLTIGLAVQPDVIRKIGESDAAMGRGLAARFLFSIPSSLVGRRDRRLRRSSEGFRGFWALIRGVDLLAGGGRPSGDGSGHFGHQNAENAVSSEGSDRWRIAGTPVSSGGQGFGDFGHRTAEKALPSSSSLADGAPSPGPSAVTPSGVLGILGTAPYKYVFGASSSSLLELYFHDLEARRPAGTGDLADLGAWSNKLDGQLVRLAAILQLIRDVAPNGATRGGEGAKEAPELITPGSGAQNAQNPRWEVGVEAVAAARILVDYLIAHAVEAHAVMQGTETGPALTRAKHLLAWIQARGKNEFTAHEAQRSLRNGVSFREPEAVQQACTTLMQLGWIRLVPREPGKVGRPSLRFIVHPDVFTASS